MGCTNTDGGGRSRFLVVSFAMLSFALSLILTILFLLLWPVLLSPALGIAALVLVVKQSRAWSVTEKRIRRSTDAAVFTTCLEEFERCSPVTPSLVLVLSSSDADMEINVDSGESGTCKPQVSEKETLFLSSRDPEQLLKTSVSLSSTLLICDESLEFILWKDSTQGFCRTLEEAVVEFLESSPKSAMEGDMMRGEQLSFLESFPFDFS